MAILDIGDDPIAARHPSMTLLSGQLCILSHTCRITLFEKGLDCNIEYLSVDEAPMRIGERNPYSETPTLIDREQVLYDSRVIVAYIDERFPHPPLLPVDPAERAKIRLIISRLIRDWLHPISILGESAKPKLPDELKAGIRDGLHSISAAFARQPYFLSDDYTLADAYLLPLLWRLPSLGIKLQPRPSQPLQKYAERMFKREAFLDGLSPEEEELR